MSLRRILAALCLVPVLLGTSGCGPSMGQNVSTFLGSVTVHERRLQASADQLEALVPQRGTAPDLAVAREKVQAILDSVRESKSEVEKLTPPEPAAALARLEVQAFDLALQRVDRLSRILAEEVALREGSAAASGAPQRLAGLRAELSDLGTRAEALDEQIRLGKIELSQKFPEVQVPEADPPARPR